MRQQIGNAFKWLGDLIAGKANPEIISTGNTGSGFIDAYKQHRQPTDTDLLNELKNTAWTCASINAAVCASNPPKLYVTTGPNQPAPKCQTKSVPIDHPVAIQKKSAGLVQEVTEHPLIYLLEQVNPAHNGFDLWELTQFYLEIFGRAYWKLDFGVFGIPTAIWPMPSQNVKAHREQNSENIVDYYEYRSRGKMLRLSPSEVLAFRLPDPKDPYQEGMGPLKGCFEQIALTSQYAAMKRAVYENTGIPSVIISPKEQMGEPERDRLENEWNAKFRKAGQGKALISGDGELAVNILSHSMGDLAALAEVKATKEDIANAFHVPIPYLTGDTNLANMEAAEIFHMRLAITPRLKRRDEKLNEQLIPMFDQSGRLFFASEDPTPTNKKHLLQQQEQDLRMGVRSINEIRIERGLAPVPWGELPQPGMAG